MREKFTEYLKYTPRQMKLPFENGDLCVVLMPTTGQGFHDWYYYLLEHPQRGIRLVRRHRILPELFPTQEIAITIEHEMAKNDAEIIASVWQKLANDQLRPMGDCAA